MGPYNLGAVIDYLKTFPFAKTLSIARKKAELTEHDALKALSDKLGVSVDDKLLLNKAVAEMQKESSRVTPSSVRQAFMAEQERLEAVTAHKEMRRRKRSHWTGAVAMVGMAAGMIPGFVNYTMQSVAVAKGAAAPAAAAVGTAASGLFVLSQALMAAYGMFRFQEGRGKDKRLKATERALTEELGRSLRAEHEGDDAVLKGLDLAEQDLARKCVYNRRLGVGYGAATAAGTLSAFGGVTLPAGAVLFVPGVTLTVGAAAVRAVWETLEKRYLGGEKASDTAVFAEGASPAEKVAEAARQAEGVGQELARIKAYALLLSAERALPAALTEAEREERLKTETPKAVRRLRSRSAKNWFRPCVKHCTTLTPALREAAAKAAGEFARGEAWRGLQDSASDRLRYGSLMNQARGEEADPERGLIAASEDIRDAGKEGQKAWRRALSREKRVHARKLAELFKPEEMAADDGFWPSLVKDGPAAAEPLPASLRAAAQRAVCAAALSCRKEALKSKLQSCFGAMATGLHAESSLRLASAGR